MDVNDRAREAWTERTDGFDRVRSVLETTRQPTAASEVADAAEVTEKTARKHLERLVDLGVATAVQDGRTTRYRRDPEAWVTRRIRELRADHDREELVDAIAEMREEVQAYRRAHDVDSPEALAATLDPADDAWADLAAWRSTERNLALAQAALSVDRATDRVEA